MINIKLIRDNPNLIQNNATNKNEKVDIQSILSLDEKKRNLIAESDKLKEQRNTASKEIANLKAKKIDADQQINQMKEVSDKIKECDDEMRSLDEQIQSLLLSIPNLLHPSVPVGKSASDNVIVRQ